jgi:hypothetical protein
MLAPATSASLLAALDSQATSNGGGGTSTRATTTAAGDETPDEVSPQRVPQRVAPVTKTKPSRRLEPGDLICGQCGEGNPPTRKFCSRCGSGLTAAQVVRGRWWRRLLPRRRTRTMEAGTRPGQKGVRRDARSKVSGSYRKIRRSLAALTLVMGMLYLAVPPLRGAINRSLANPTAGITERVGGWWHALTYPYEDVPVRRSRGVPEARGHPGSETVDGNTASFWAAGWAEKRSPRLVVRFEESQDLAAVVIHNGASGENAERYLQPKELEFRYGDGRTEDVGLKFSSDPQTIELEGGSTVRTITIFVRSVHDKEGLTRIALRELEFKTRK